MFDAPCIWQNGEFVRFEDAKVHVLTHTLHYGGGVFEGIRFYDTEKGIAIFKLADHIKRLFFSAQVLDMKMNYTEADICEITRELVRRNQIREGYIRPLVYYGHKKMGVSPIGNPVEIAIACWIWPAYLPEAVNVTVSKKYIRVHHKSTNINAKMCGNYLNGVLASLELQQTGGQEALLLDSEGYVSEGVGENFFIVKNKTVYTPNLGTILPGLTRETVMALCQEGHINVIEKDITLEEAYSADEAFFTGTAAEVTWIRSIDGHVIGDGEIGKVTSLIKRAYYDVVRGKNPKFLNHLDFIPGTYSYSL